MSQPDFQLATVVSYPFEENTYIAHLSQRSDCLVFDPGLEPDKILAHLEDQNLTPAAIICTHGHSDHIGGCGTLKEKWPDCPLVIGEVDAPMLTDAHLNLSAAFGVPITSPPATEVVREGDRYEAAGFELEVLDIPGHSPGHVVFVWKSPTPAIVFGGDVLFHGSIGRTDFPGGDFQQLQAGIHEKLFTMPDSTIVLPGHGSSTTVGDEKSHNPFVGRPSGYAG